MTRVMTRMMSDCYSKSSGVPCVPSFSAAAELHTPAAPSAMHSRLPLLDVYIQQQRPGIVTQSSSLWVVFWWVRMRGLPYGLPCNCYLTP